MYQALVLACFYRSMLDGWGPIRSTSGREQKGSKDDAEKIIRELSLTYKPSTYQGKGVE